MQNFAKTVLIVEDDGMLRDLLVVHFKSAFNVLAAEDGERALAIAAESKPDIMLLDLLLPKVDGFGVLEAIRKNADKTLSTLPVVVLSNLWTNKDILRTQALHIDAYFVKADTNLDVVYAKVVEILTPKVTEGE